MFRITLISMAALLGLGAVMVPVHWGNETSLVTDTMTPMVNVPSAIALLGDTWEFGGRGPVVEEAAASPTTAPGPPGLATALDASAPGGEQVASAVDILRRPIPRPQLEPPIITQASVGFNEVPDARGTTASEAWDALPMRWTVRRQGTGEVIAELPLDEALSLLDRRPPFN